MKDRIVQYAAQGFADVKIAEILGCTAAYISQVKAEDTFAEDLAEAKKRIRKTKEEEEREEEYVRLESSVLNQIRENLPFAEFKDLTILMDKLIQRKAKANVTINNHGIIHNDNSKNTTVLQIPAAVVPEIVLNERQEMIAVGEQTLAPMTTGGVRNLFKAIENKRQVEKLVAMPVEDVLEIPEDF